jgi:ATP-binding protein involved in chromosome partitioning
VDADLYGPDVPRMLGLRRDTPAKSVTLAHWVKGGGIDRPGSLEAMEVDGLQVASAGFLMDGRQGLAIDSAFGNMLLARLVGETAWRDVTALVVDLPPGTGDVQQALLGMAGLVAAVLVVTPAEISHLDTGRALTVLRASRAHILGGVENMAYLECPSCGEPTELHVPAPADRTIWAQGVSKLARLPFRPDGLIAGDALSPVVSTVVRHLDAA